MELSELSEYSWLSYVVVITLVYRLLKNGIAKSILNPYSVILVNYFLIFKKVPSYYSNQLMTNFCLIISFFFFSLTFFFFSNRKLSFYSALKFRYIEKFSFANKINISTTRNLCIIIVLYLIGNYYFNSIVYGGFEKSLVRFYVGKPVIDVNTSWFTLDQTLYSICLVLLSVVRFTYTKNKSIVVYIYYLISIIALLLVSIPRGTRGAILAPVLGVVFIDCLHYLKNRNQKYRFFPFQIDTITILVVGVMFTNSVSYFRGENFNSVSEAVDFISNIEIKSNEVNDDPFDTTKYVNFCIENFGNKFDYLYFHTPYTMLVNPIPRSIWLDKPIGFGRLIGFLSSGQYASLQDLKGVDANAITSSFAAGLAGEGYAHGGLIGVVLFSMFFGMISGTYANIAFYSFNFDNIVINIIGLSFYSASSAFVRGAMLDAWAQSFYFLIATILLLYISTVFLKNKKA